MAERVVVPEPTPAEQTRQLAEALADLHEAVGIIVENGKYFVPGEAYEQLRTAWTATDKRMQDLIKALGSPTPNGLVGDIGPSEPELQKAGLLGAAGKAKRRVLGWLHDIFMGLWNEEPKGTDFSRKVRAAAQHLLEAGETVLGSIKEFEYAEEFVSITRQLIGMRDRRGD